MLSHIIHITDKFINEHPIAVGSIVAAANGAVTTLTVLDDIKTGLSIAGGIMTLLIGAFTLRLLYLKIKNFKK